jgi:hypothetical protein
VNAFVRAGILSAGCFGASIPAAHADLIFSPFAGKTFAAHQTLSPIADVDKQTWTIGVSAALLTANILGAEVDFGYAPRFFASDRQLNVVGSHALSLTGNVLLAVPLSVTRESLRPYVSVGMGMLHAGIDDQAGIETVDRNLLAVSIGGGAIGFLSPRVGVRFDLRSVRSTSRGLDNKTLLTEPRLGFWRATVGVAIRYR